MDVLAGQHGHGVSNGSRCVYDVYRVTTCRHGRGHTVAASRLQLVIDDPYVHFHVRNVMLFTDL